MTQRTSIADLKLQGSSNLKRALSRKPLPALAKREDLEALYADVMERRREALADIKANGQLIWQDKWHGPKLSRIRVVNPAVKIAQQCEHELRALAKMLAARPVDPDVPRKEPTGIELAEAIAAGETVN